MKHYGMTVMLHELMGNKETVDIVKESLGKMIKRTYMENDKLCLEFTDEKTILIFDDGQSCCEERYMMTDDDLDYYKDCEFINLELQAAADIKDESEMHEVQFVLITTSLGVFTMATHNIHNGYYSGFSVVVEEKDDK